MQGANCDSIEIQQCINTTGLHWYQYTVFPNFLNHNTQKEAMESFEESLSLINSDCHEHALRFTCGVHVPPCDRGRRIPPCREFCREFYMKCGASVPYIVDCKNLPAYENDDTVCLSAPAIKEMPIRLVDGATSLEGRVEVQKGETWGTVCQNGWSDRDAGVVCRQLGYLGGTARGAGYFGPGTGPIFLDEVMCIGDEEHLGLCRFGDWENNNCVHANDVGVTCIPPVGVEVTSDVTVRLRGSQYDSEGLVEVQHKDQWAPVCDDGFDISEALVVCRMLGFTNMQGVTVVSNSGYRQATDAGRYWLDGLRCSGEENNLAFCDHEGWGVHNCGINEMAAVVCVSRATTTTTTPSTTTVPTTPTTLPAISIRLAGGAHPAEGRVEILYQGVWGSICDDNFHFGNVLVVCRMLGYESSEVAEYTSWSRYTNTAPSTGPIWLDDVFCEGDESSILRCQYNGWDSSNCQHDEDVVVTCDYPATTTVTYEGEIAVRVGRDKMTTIPPEVTTTETETTTLKTTSSSTMRTEFISSSTTNTPMSSSSTNTPSSTFSTSSTRMSTSPTISSTTQSTSPTSSTTVTERTTTVTMTTMPTTMTKLPTTLTKSTTTMTTVVVPTFRTRLVDGTDSMSGRVEVYYQGQWGTVCDDLFSNNEASVVCRSLGFSDGFMSPESFGPGTDPIWLDSVICVGSEEWVGDCSHEPWGQNNCQHGEDVGVICQHVSTARSSSTFSTTSLPSTTSTTLPTTTTTTASNPLPVILSPMNVTNGVDNATGILLVNTSSSPSYICNTSLTQDDVTAICRQLGFRGTGKLVAPPTSFTNQNARNIVRCPGDGVSCDPMTWITDQSCASTHIAAIDCIDERVRLLDTYQSGKARIVQVFLNNQWGTVCNDEFDPEDATVLCRMLGFNGTGKLEETLMAGPSSAPIWLDDLQCTGEEKSVFDCPRAASSNCNHNEDVFLVCYSQADEVDVRLVGGRSPHEGRLEVKYNEVWGSVCDDAFDFNDAQVFCRMLGLNIESAQILSIRDLSLPALAPNVPTWLDDLQCDGDEKSVTLCLRSDWGKHNCNHMEDVALSCPPLSTTSSVQITTTKVSTISTTGVPSQASTPSGPLQIARLAGGPSASEGRVEILHNGVWGSVCSVDFNDTDAEVVCRTLGISGVARVLIRNPLGSQGPVWLSRVQCTGQEQTIMDCQSSDWGDVEGCSHFQDVYITCKADVSPVRLVNGNHPKEGRVEIYHDGQWGTICDDAFDLNDAKAICTSLGYNASDAEYLMNKFGPGPGKIWLESLRCTGQERHLTDCRHDGWGNHNCLPGEDISVSCGLPDPPSCKPITEPRICAENMPYNFTSMPNILGHTTQSLARSHYNFRNWHHMVALCDHTHELPYLICGYLTPKCTASGDGIETERPCRSLCERSKSQCEGYMIGQGLTWPEEFDCGALPTSDCFDPWVTETTVDKCQPISIPLCDHDLSYTLTQMPNILNHQDQQAAATAMKVWNTAIGVECHPHIRPYLCSFYAPNCDQDVPLRPCRHVCIEVVRECSQFTFGDTPDEFRCNEMPDKFLGEDCLEFESDAEPSTPVPRTTKVTASSRVTEPSTTNPTISTTLPSSRSTTLLSPSTTLPSTKSTTFMPPMPESTTLVRTPSTIFPSKQKSTTILNPELPSTKFTQPVPKSTTLLQTPTTTIPTQTPKSTTLINAVTESSTLLHSSSTTIPTPMPKSSTMQQSSTTMPTASSSTTNMPTQATTTPSRPTPKSTTLKTPTSSTTRPYVRNVNGTKLSMDMMTSLPNDAMTTEADVVTMVGRVDSEIVMGENEDSDDVTSQSHEVMISEAVTVTTSTMDSDKVDSQNVETKKTTTTKGTTMSTQLMTSQPEEQFDSQTVAMATEPSEGDDEMTETSEINMPDVTTSLSLESKEELSAISQQVNTTKNMTLTSTERSGARSESNDLSDRTTVPSIDNSFIDSTSRNIPIESDDSITHSNNVESIENTTLPNSNSNQDTTDD